MIEEFKDKIEVLKIKNILTEVRKLEPLREQETNEIKNETKRKLNMSDNKISNVLRKL